MAQYTRKSAGCMKARWTVTTPEPLPVYLTGSTPELGEWNPDRALPLRVQHVGGHLNDWNIDLVLPRGQAVEFKFIEKTKDPGMYCGRGARTACSPLAQPTPRYTGAHSGKRCTDSGGSATGAAAGEGGKEWRP